MAIDQAIPRPPAMDALKKSLTSFQEVVKLEVVLDAIASALATTAITPPPSNAKAYALDQVLKALIKEGVLENGKGLLSSYYDLAEFIERAKYEKEFFIDIKAADEQREKLSDGLESFFTQHSAGSHAKRQ